MILKGHYFKWPFERRVFYLYADKTAAPLEPAFADHSLAIVAPTLSKCFCKT